MFVCKNSAVRNVYSGGLQAVSLITTGNSMQRLALLSLLLLLSACQNQSGNTRSNSEGFYVYTDAQGNLVTMRRAEKKAVPKNGGREAYQQSGAVTSKDDPTPEAFSQSDVDDYRPSEEVDEELAARENERFITYVDEMGQLVSRPLDMKAERKAAQDAPAPYEEVTEGAFLETYRALRADCCMHLIETAKPLEPGAESVVTFDRESPVLKGDSPWRAVAFAPADEVSEISLVSFIRKKGYLGAELLWLNSKGVPVMMIDQPFSRKYPETWYRYGYLQGTLEREQGQHYLIVFLPYLDARPASDGLKQVIEGELVLSAP